MYVRERIEQGFGDEHSLLFVGVSASVADVRMRSAISPVGKSHWLFASVIAQLMIETFKLGIYSLDTSLRWRLSLTYLSTPVLFAIS